MPSKTLVSRLLGALMFVVALSTLTIACGDDAADDAGRIRDDCKRECEKFGFFDCVSSANVADCVDGCNTSSLSDAEAFSICAAGGICDGVDCLERFNITVQPTGN